MARIRWRAVVQCSAGSIALELLTFVYSRPRPQCRYGCVSISSQLTRIGRCLFHRNWLFGLLLCSTDSLFPGERSNRKPQPSLLS
jgi:hypothetical protein